MCDKCDDLDKKIEHYRRIHVNWRSDHVERLAGLIGDLKAHKATLHPGQKQ
jgi:hypothetical protein